MRPGAPSRYAFTATWMGLRWPMPSMCPWAPCWKSRKLQKREQSKRIPVIPRGTHTPRNTPYPKPQHRPHRRRRGGLETQTKLSFINHLQWGGALIRAGCRWLALVSAWDTHDPFNQGVCLLFWGSSKWPIWHSHRIWLSCRFWSEFLQWRLQSFRYSREGNCKGQLTDRPVKKEANPKPTAKKVVLVANDEEAVSKPQRQATQKTTMSSNPLNQLALYYQMIQNEFIKQKQEKYNSLCRNMFVTILKRPFYLLMEEM